MKQLQTKLLTIALSIAITVGITASYPKHASADTTIHVRIVGSTKTIFVGDVTPSGCTITDESNVAHTFATPVAVCALDTAATTGNFPYGVKDFGGSLGLFLDSIATDKSASDFSTFWTYDINGAAAQQGISSQAVKAGDILYFHFTDPNADLNVRVLNDGISYLKSQQNTDGSIKGFNGISDWAAIAFAANGVDVNTVINGNASLLNYLQSNPPASDAAATEWARDILAITAAGQNPFDFGNTNYVSKLENLDTNNQIGSATQINDDIFGLLALVASGPDASSPVKQDALNFILAHQEADGGFSWSTTGTSDTDDTAAAIQALVAAQNAGISATGLADDIAKAKTFMLSNKKSDNGFAYSATDTSNTSTTSWAVMALSALGVNDSIVTNADTFIRNNQEENGSFHWQSPASGETFTSSYALVALAGKHWPIAVYGATVSPSISETPSSTVSPTISEEPSISPSEIPSPPISEEPTVIVSPTPSETLSPSPTEEVTPTEEISPTGEPTAEPNDTVTPSEEVSPTSQPTDNGGSRHHGRQVRQLEDEIHRLQDENRRLYKQLQIFIHEIENRFRHWKFF